VITTAQNIGRSIFLSAEYVNRQRSNTEYVTDLFAALLQRARGTEQVLGQTRLAMLNDFLNRAEFQSLAGALYHEVDWLVPDHLGTPRMIADKTGSLSGIKRHDYLPFGEEFQAGTGGRTVGQGYTADNIRQKFTDKERDNETSFDFFGARYYGATLGRFTSIDPLLANQWCQLKKSRFHLLMQW